DQCQREEPATRAELKQADDFDEHGCWVTSKTWKVGGRVAGVPPVIDAFVQAGEPDRGDIARHPKRVAFLVVAVPFPLKVITAIILPTESAGPVHSNPLRQDVRLAGK